MNPFFLSALIARIIGLKRVCIKCKRSQFVPSDMKEHTVPCKFCGTDIPPKKMNK